MSADREERKEKGGKEEGARLDPPAQPPKSTTFQQPDSPRDNDASIQKTNSNSFQFVFETQMGGERESTQDNEGGLQMGNTIQVTEYYLKEEKVEEEEERKRWSEEEKNRVKEEMEKDPCKEEQRKRWKREEEESDEKYHKEIKIIEERYKSFGFGKDKDPIGAET